MGNLTSNRKWCWAKHFRCCKFRSTLEIYGYRMSLWAEHKATIEQCFERLESLECVRRMRVFGEHNWPHYTANEVTEMRGHLLKYLLKLIERGELSCFMLSFFPSF